MPPSCLESQGSFLAGGGGSSGMWSEVQGNEGWLNLGSLETIQMVESTRWSWSYCMSFFFNHFYWYMCVCVCVCVSCLVMSDCDPKGYSPPGSSVHGIFQARILERVAILFPRESSQSRDWTQVSSIAGRFFTIRATREALSLTYYLYTIKYTHFKYLLQWVLVNIYVCIHTTQSWHRTLQKVPS